MISLDPNLYQKVPGLFALSELPQALDLEGDSVVSRVGSLEDGTPLFEVYRFDRRAFLELARQEEKTPAAEIGQG